MKGIKSPSHNMYLLPKFRYSLISSQFILGTGSASKNQSEAPRITLGFNLMYWNIKGKNGKKFKL